MMSYKKIHFLYEEEKRDNFKFAKSLIKKLGQSDIKDADVIVTIGGDGLLMQALREANGTPVYGIKPPKSNSRGFWTDHDVVNAQILENKLSEIEEVTLYPIKAEIHYTNKRKVIKHAFNDVAVERASGQAVILNLTAQFAKYKDGPYRFMGDGLNFSTAMGSTGTNRSYGGPAVDIHKDVLVLTGKGIYDPQGVAPIVMDAGKTKFHIDFASVAHKRPVRIDYDGYSIGADQDGSPINGLTISVDHEQPAKLLVSNEPGLRAFSAMKPNKI